MKLSITHSFSQPLTLPLQLVSLGGGGGVGGKVQGTDAKAMQQAEARCGNPLLRAPASFVLERDARMPDACTIHGAHLQWKMDREVGTRFSVALEHLL